MAFRKRKIQTDLIQESANGYAIAVEGKTVVSFQEAPSENVLRLEDAHSLRIIIENGKLEPDINPQELVGKRMASMFADNDGDLFLRFDEGIEYCIKHCEYKSWHVINDLTLHIVSCAGGGVAIWL